MNALVSTAFWDRNYAGRRPLPISARLMPRASLLCAVESRNEVTSPAKEVVPMRDMVAYLCNGLPIATISDMIGVERKTVYSWLDGVAPRAFHAAKVEAIFHILSESKTDLKSLYRVLNRPIANGPSIRHLLSEKCISERAVMDALTALGPAMAQHTARDAARRAPTAGARNPWIDDMPTTDSAD